MRKKNAMINILGVQIADGETETVELMTEGNYYQKGPDTFYITYAESEATGYEGDTTTLKVENDKKVTMLRFGNTRSQLVIERGERNICHYDTGYGNLTVGIFADEIVSRLDENGGKLHVAYDMDINTQHALCNELDIEVKLIQ